MVLTELLVDFSKRQQALIGDLLVNPGHGFASSREFQGIGLSDDVALMISDQFFEEFEIPFREKIGCGLWGMRHPFVRELEPENPGREKDEKPGDGRRRFCGGDGF